MAAVVDIGSGRDVNTRGPTPSGFAYEIYKSHDLKIDL